MGKALQHAGETARYKGGTLQQRIWTLRCAFDAQLEELDLDEATTPRRPSLITAGEGGTNLTATPIAGLGEGDYMGA